jgi:hypothetical protein
MQIYKSSRMQSLGKTLYKAGVLQIKIVGDRAFCRLVFMIITRRTYWCRYHVVNHSYYAKILYVMKTTGLFWQLLHFFLKKTFYPWLVWVFCCCCFFVIYSLVLFWSICSWALSGRLIQVLVCQMS